METRSRNLFFFLILFDRKKDFPGGPVVKNLPVNARDVGSTSDLGRFHMLWGN